MRFVGVWCVYYAFYVYMGQVPEIKLMVNSRKQCVSVCRTNTNKITSNSN